MEPRTVQLPQFSLRAAVVPESIDEKARTVEVVFSRRGVSRHDWRS
jgi:hypothetical protein